MKHKAVVEDRKCHSITTRKTYASSALSAKDTKSKVISEKEVAADVGNDFDFAVLYV